MKNRRQKAYLKGIWAERYAAVRLLFKGFRIVATRFKTPVGEVDLIARRKDLVLFVEVKARANETLALESVTPSAKKRIEAAGEWWLSQQKDAANLSWRFDVVAVVPRKLPIHFEDVW